MSAINNVYEGLVQYEPGTVKVVGRLAHSWEVSDDGREYVFRLVDGVKVSRRHRDECVRRRCFLRPKEGRKLALSYFLSNVERLEPVDRLTLKIVLRRAQTLFHRQPREVLGVQR